MNADLKSGIDIVLSKLKLDEIIPSVDLIITGEGKIDEQSKMGKVLSGIGKLGLKFQVPVIALAGSIIDNLSLENIGITSAFSITNRAMTLEEAVDKEGTKIRLKSVSSEIINLLKHIKKER